MTDIDALIERLKRRRDIIGPDTDCAGAAAALERMRDDSIALRARLAEVEGALRKCRNYIISPLRMTKDEDEHKRRQDIIYDATAALARAGVTERLMPDPHAGTGTDEKDAVLVPQEGSSEGSSMSKVPELAMPSPEGGRADG